MTAKTTKTTEKPPTQTTSVGGFDAHGRMGEAPMEVPFQQYVNWQKLVSLPAFEMFVFEESGFTNGALARQWVRDRRASMGDDKLYDLYASWHERKGLWVNETPTGRLI